MLKMIKKKLNSGMGKDVVWTFSLQITIMLCAFVITKLLASRLSIDDFGQYNVIKRSGQYNVIKRSVQVLSFVMLAGVGIALPRYIPLYQKGTPPRRIAPLLSASLIYIIGISLVVFIICMVFSTQMEEFVIGQSGQLSLLLIALAYAFTLAMAQFAYAYYRGIGDFKWYNGTQLAVQLAIVLPLVLLPMLTVRGVFTSWLVITALLVAFFGWKAFIRGRRKEEGGRRLPFSQDSAAGVFSFLAPPSSFLESLRTIIKYSSGRLLADFFLFSLAAFPLIYISNAQGLQPTAYYSVGITFVTMVTPVFSFMGIILLPYVSECIAKGEMKAANRFVNRLSLLYVGASMLITIVLYLFTAFLTCLLFASDYVVTTDLTRIMILAILPQAIYLLYRNPIDAVAVIPYNTIILGICLAVMVVSFSLSSTLTQFAWAYLIVSLLQGLLSFLTWQIVKRKA